MSIHFDIHEGINLGKILVLSIDKLDIIHEEAKSATFFPRIEKFDERAAPYPFILPLVVL